MTGQNEINLIDFVSFSYIHLINKSYFLMIFTQMLSTALSAALIIFIIMSVGDY